MNWGEAEYLEELERIEKDCRRVPPLLIDLAHRRGMVASSPKVVSMLSQVASIAQRCCEERERLGLWREDGLEPDEILDEIDQQLSEFVQTMESTLPKSRCERRRKNAG